MKYYMKMYMILFLLLICQETKLKMAKQKYFGFNFQKENACKL